MSRTTVLLWLGYFALLAAALLGVDAASAWVSANLKPEEWPAWQEETQRLSKSEGPEKRRATKATQPPMLILFKEHYGTVVASAVVSVTVFYWLFAVLIRGAIRTPPVRGLDESEPIA